ncbi:MAG: hemin uptake protein HemP [Sulfuritalea sp.]
MKNDSRSPTAKPEIPPIPAGRPRPLDSVTLLGTKGEVEITHQGETYRLRRTRQGKLILTK